MNVLNTKYNKTVYGSLAFALTVILVWVLKDFAGIELSEEVEGAFLFLITMGVVYFVPNLPDVDTSEE